MPSKGSGEIEAARLRLVAAKSKKKSAIEMVESAQVMNKTAEVMTSSARDMTDKAKTMMDAAAAMANTARTNTESAKAMSVVANNNMVAAQSQLDTADQEISEAEAMLKRTEEKWQVIDVDDSPKKAEKSSNSATNNGTNQAAAGEIIDVDEEIAAGIDSVNNGHSLAAAISAASSEIVAALNSTGNTQLVTINGCGSRGANGIYIRDHEFIGSTHHNSFTKKSGSLTYALYRKDSYWYVSIWNCHAVYKTLYRTMNRSKTGLPPESGWMSIDGESPAPKLKQ